MCVAVGGTPDTLTLMILFAVKLWYTTQPHSVMSLEAKVNVCCVKFNPKSQYHLAFGSAGTRNIILLKCYFVT